MLDRVARWDRELNDEEQRLLAFARLALHKPRWVVIDEALDTLGGDARSRVFAALEKDLAGAAIVNIGLAERNSHFFTRVVHLEADPKGHALKPMKHRGAAPRRQPVTVEALSDDERQRRFRRVVNSAGRAVFCTAPSLTSVTAWVSGQARG